MGEDDRLGELAADVFHVLRGEKFVDFAAHVPAEDGGRVRVDLGNQRIVQGGGIGHADFGRGVAGEVFVGQENDALVAEGQQVLQHLAGVAGGAAVVGLGFDVGMEMSGNQQALDQMVDNLVMGGRIAMLGIPPGKSPVDWSRIVFKAITIKGVYGREIFETWYKMIAMLENGLDVRRVITHRFKADDFAQGFEVMRSGLSGKVVLDWS